MSLYQPPGGGSSGGTSTSGVSSFATPSVSGSITASISAGVATIVQHVADATHDGYLASGDFNNFNTLTSHRAVRMASTQTIVTSSSKTIDGVATVTGDRVLLKNQTLKSQNGIWIANNSGAWTRATDMPAGVNLNGISVAVSEGTTQAGTVWVCTATGTITVGTDLIDFLSVAPRTDVYIQRPNGGTIQFLGTSNNATTAYTQSLNRGGALNQAMAASVSGDCIYMGPGDFNMADSGVARSDVGITLRGCGIGTTNILSSSILSSETILTVTSGSTYRDFTLNANLNTFQYPFGAAPGYPFDNVTVRSVRVVGGSDALYVWGAAGQNMKIYDSLFDSNYDSVAILSSNLAGASAGTYEFFNSKFTVTYGGMNSKILNCINNKTGLVKLHNCTLTASGTWDSLQTVGVYNYVQNVGDRGGSAEIRNCEFNVWHPSGKGILADVINMYNNSGIISSGTVKISDGRGSNNGRYIVGGGGPITFENNTQPFQAPSYEWSPLDIPGGQWWLDTSNASHMWREVGGQNGAGVINHPSVPGTDQVGVIVDPINGIMTFGNSTGNCPFWASDSTQLSSLQFIGVGNTTYVANAQMLFAPIWTSGMQNYTLMTKVKCNSDGGRQYILDGGASDTSSNKGFSLVYGDSAGAIKFMVPTSPGNFIWNVETATGVLVNDGKWHTLVIRADGVSGYMTFDNTLVASSVLTIANTLPLVSGYPQLCTQPVTLGAGLNGQIADMFFSNVDLAKVNFGQDITRWRMYNPQYGPKNRNHIIPNAAYGGTVGTGYIGYSGVQEALYPTQVVGLIDWTDATDRTRMRTTMSGVVAALSDGNITYTTPLIFPGATQPSADDDRVSCILSKGTNPYLMNAAYNTSVNNTPRYKNANTADNIVSVPCVRYTGDTINNKAQNLSHINWPDTAKTWFIVVQAHERPSGLNPLPGSGAQFPTMGAGNQYMAFATPNWHGSNTENTVVQHFTAPSTGGPGSIYGGYQYQSNNASAIGSLPAMNPSGWNIAEVVQDGGAASIWINGYWSYDLPNGPGGGPNNSKGTVDGTGGQACGLFTGGSLGTPAGAYWDLYGYFAHKIVYVGALDSETRRRIRLWIANQLAIPNVNVNN